MTEPENSFYFLGDYYQYIGMEQNLSEILGFSFFIFLLLYFTIKIYKRRRCPNCNKFMKRNLNDKYEFVYLCHDCATVTKTGISFRIDDS